MTDDYSSLMSTSIRYRFGNLLIENKLFLIVELLLLGVICIIDVPFFTIIPVVFLGWLSLRLRWISWRDIGFNLQFDWIYTFSLGFGLGILLFIGDHFVYTFIVEEFRGYTPNKNIICEFDHSIYHLFTQIAIAWSLVAVGEELFFRGFIISRFDNSIKSPKISLYTGISLNLLIFALSFFMQNRGDLGMGVFVSVVLTGAYLFNNKHLGLPILISGFYNTLTILMELY